MKRGRGRAWASAFAVAGAVGLGAGGLDAADLEASAWANELAAELENHVGPELATSVSGREVVAALPGVGTHDTWIAAECEVAGSAACSAVVDALADLAVVPRHHTIRARFERETRDRTPFSGAIAEPSEPAARNPHPVPGFPGPATFAVIQVEDADGANAGLHLARSRTEDGYRVTPAWLTHAVVESWGPGVDRGLGLARQWVERASLASEPSAADAALGAGVPAVRLVVPPEADVEDWSRRLATTVRRLDALAGRPDGDDEYLVLAGGVRPRRTLYWAGFVLWVALLFVGRPGRWRRASSADRRQAGRRYLPAFAFRVLFLVAVLASPALALPLLAPAAILSALPVAGRRGRWCRIGAGLLPLLAWLVTLAAGLTVGGGEATIFAPGAVAGGLALVAAALTAFVVLPVGEPVTDQA